MFMVKLTTVYIKESVKMGLPYWLKTSFQTAGWYILIAEREKMPAHCNILITKITI